MKWLMCNVWIINHYAKKRNTIGQLIIIQIANYFDESKPLSPVAYHSRTGSCWQKLSVWFARPVHMAAFFFAMSFPFFIIFTEWQFSRWLTSWSIREHISISTTKLQSVLRWNRFERGRSYTNQVPWELWRSKITMTENGGRKRTRFLCLYDDCSGFYTHANG